MSDDYGPTTRPDSAPLHVNAIRRYREELRLDRREFADLLDLNIDTLRVWEAGASKPRAPAALHIIASATRNNYPMTIEDIFPEKPKKKPRKKK